PGGVPGGVGATGATSTAPPRIPGQPPAGLRVEGNGTTGPATRTAPGPGEVGLSAFSGAVDLKTLVEYVAEALQINIAGDDTLTGSVVLNAPVVVKKNELLPLLNSLLEQHDFTINRNEIGWYEVTSVINVRFSTLPDSTTRVIA